MTELRKSVTCFPLTTLWQLTHLVQSLFPLETKGTKLGEVFFPGWFFFFFFWTVKIFHNRNIDVQRFLTRALRRRRKYEFKSFFNHTTPLHRFLFCYICIIFAAEYFRESFWFLISRGIKVRILFELTFINLNIFIWIYIERVPNSHLLGRQKGSTLRHSWSLFLLEQSSLIIFRRYRWRFKLLT